MLISDICHRHPVTIGPDLPLTEAIEKMLELDVNGFVVINEQRRVVGILSLQDIAAACNVLAFSQAEREQMSVGFGRYLKLAFPLTIINALIVFAILWLRYGR